MGSAAVLLAQARILTVEISRPTLTQGDIASSIKNGDDDIALDAVIRQYITDWSLTETVAEWRVANYAQLRQWAYPPVEEYLAAVAVGDQAALDQYSADYLAVKVRFPLAPTAPNPTFISGLPLPPYTITADSTDEFTFLGIPNPSTVTVTGPGIYPVTGVAWEITGGQFTFMVDTAGDYAVEIDSGTAYLINTYAITAEDP